MSTAFQAPPQASDYADCLEAVRSRLAAREAKLYGIAVLVVHVHQLERLFASAGQVNAARMLDELRNRLSQVMKPGDYFARLGDRKFVFVLSNLRNEGHAVPMTPYLGFPPLEQSQCGGCVTYYIRH